MIELNFASFGKVLLHYKKTGITQKKLVGAILSVFGKNYDISYDDRKTSGLIRGYDNLSPDVISLVETQNPSNIAAHFCNKVIPLLNPNKQEYIIIALKKIIEADHNIKPYVLVELVNDITKERFLEMNEIVFDELLAGLFIYIVKYTENGKQNENVKLLDDDFFDDIEKSAEEVSLISSYTLAGEGELETIGIDAHTSYLLAVCENRCPNCGNMIVPVKSTFILMDNGQKIPLCNECWADLQNSVEKKKNLEEIWNHLQMRNDAYTAAAEQKIERNIKELLIQIGNKDPYPQISLSTRALKINKKIVHDILLRDKVRDWVIGGRYQMIKKLIQDLSASGEINGSRLDKNIKRMYEDVLDTTTDQRNIFETLVNAIDTQTGHMHSIESEILVSYYVQHCEVFGEAA